MKTRMKRVGTVVLSLIMIFGIIPVVSKPIEVQAANSAPTTAYWTEASSLKTGYNLNGGTIAKVRFGANDREWAICGADTADNTGNSLALLSTSEFTTAEYDSTSPYEENYSSSDFVIDLKKYIDNNHNGSTYLGSTYFSNAELDKMQKVTVSTLEDDQQEGDDKRTESHRLYLPDAVNGSSVGSTSIFVGTNNDIEIALSNLRGMTTNGSFWLRSPFININANSFVLTASPEGIVDRIIASSYVSIVPALNLNLSSVIFASAAKAASSAGEKTSEMTASTYTLRYAPTDNSWDDTSAVISADKTSVQVSGASSGMYLMVQNSDGVYAVDASSNSLVSASSITIDSNQLTDFENCKVWLESTDTGRITTAKLATQAPSTYDVTITPASNSHMNKTDGSGAANQTGITAGNSMTSVVYTAASGYYFPTNYSVASVTGISVHRDSYTQITVSGTPTATTTITLTAATEKASQNAPTGLSDDVDKIAGTTTAMEYASSADAASWNACTADNTTVAAGTWYVRLKETDTQKASTSTSVVVTASQNPPTPTPTPTPTVTITAGAGGTHQIGTDTTPTKDEVPKTGDSTPVVWLFVVAMISGTGLLYLGRRKKAIR